MRHINVMFELGSTGLWEITLRDGQPWAAMTDLAALALPDDLARRLTEWCWDDREGDSAHDHAGKSLAREVRANLPDTFRITYAGMDPQTHRQLRYLVSPDGSLLLEGPPTR
jgi:hypothetical protein